MTDPAVRASAAHLIELVLEVDGPVHAVEPLMRGLRQRLERVADRGEARQVGTVVSQEFGRLTCTVRAVVDDDDLLQSAQLALRGIRPMISDALADQTSVTVRETGLHARLL